MSEEFKIKLGADTSEVQQKIGKIGQDFEQMGRKSDTTFSKLGTSFDKSTQKMKDNVSKVKNVFLGLSKDSGKAAAEMEKDFEAFADTFKKEMDTVKRSNKDVSEFIVNNQKRVKAELFNVGRAAQKSGKDVEEAFNRAASKLPSEMGSAANEVKKDFQKMQKEAEEAAQKSQEAWKRAGEKMSNIGTGISVGGAAVGAAGAGAGVIANNRENAKKNLQASLGLNKKQTEEQFQTMDNIYLKGLGEDLTDVGHAFITVKQNMSSIDGKELEKVTQYAMNLEKLFGADINESTRTASTLMKQFGINATEAFDVMTYGFQNGLNKNGDLADTLNEYSMYFKDLGKDAQDFVTILKTAKDNGVWSMDKAGDLFKEGRLRMGNVGKPEAEALAGAFGYDMKVTRTRQEVKQEHKKDKNGKDVVVQKVKLVPEETSNPEFDRFLKEFQDDINAGGERASKRLSQVAEQMAKLSDSDRYRYGIALFGTQWEDVGSQISMAMIGAQKKVDGISNSSKKAAKVTEESFSVKFAATMRDLQKAVEPMGKAFLDLAQSAMPTISKYAGIMAEKIEKLSKWFDGLSQTQKDNVVQFGLMAAAMGPVLFIGGKIVSMFSKFGGLFAGAGMLSKMDGASGKITGLGKAFGGLATRANPFVVALAGSAAIFTAIEKFAPEKPMSAAQKLAEEFKKSMEKVRDEWDKTNEKLKKNELDATIDAKTGKKANKKNIEGIQGGISDKADIAINEINKKKQGELDRIAAMKNDKKFYSKNKGLVDGMENQSKDVIARMDGDINKIRNIEKGTNKTLKNGIGKNGVMSESALKEASNAQIKIAEISQAYMKELNTRSLKDTVDHYQKSKEAQDQYVIDSVAKAQEEYESKKTAADNQYNESIAQAETLYKDLGTIDEAEYTLRITAAETLHTDLIAQAQATKDEYLTVLKEMVGEIDAIVNETTGKVTATHKMLEGLKSINNVLTKPLDWAADKSINFGKSLYNYVDYGMDATGLTDLIPKRNPKKIPADMKVAGSIANSLVPSAVNVAVEIGGELASLANKVSTKILDTTNKKSSYRAGKLR